MPVEQKYNNYVSLIIYVNLTDEFLYDNFKKKILLQFPVKLVTQKLTCQTLCIFKEK